MGKSLLGKHELALEAIAFQPTHFGKLLENIFQEMRDTGVKSAKGFYDLGFDKLIIKAVEDHTNFVVPRIDFVENLGMNSSVEFNIDYAKHIFNHEMLRNVELSAANAQKILDRLSAIKDTTYVDLKNNRVHGQFKKIINRFILSTDLILEPRVTPAGVAAVLLHEIGHGFSYCEFFDRFSTTNQILAAVARSIKDPDIEKRKVVFTTASKLLNTNPSAFDSLEENDNLTSVAVVVLDAAFKTNSAVESGAYDESSFEAMADNYAARCGYGRALVEIIELLPEYDRKNMKGQSARIGAGFGIVYIGGIITLTFASTLGVLGIMGGATIAAIYYAIVSIVYGGSTYKDYTYDGTKVRMKRVKEQLIEYLKDPTIPNDQRKRTLEDFEKIDQIISKTTHAKVALFDRISNFLYAKNKTLKTRIELQRDLEELAHNELFVAAAKLRSIQ